MAQTLQYMDYQDSSSEVRWKRIIVLAMVYVLSAAAIWFGLGGLRFGFYRDLATEGVQVQATVEATDNGNHASFTYSFHTTDGRKIIRTAGKSLEIQRARSFIGATQLRYGTCRVIQR